MVIENPIAKDDVVEEVEAASVPRHARKRTHAPYSRLQMPAKRPSKQGALDNRMPSCHPKVNEDICRCVQFLQVRHCMLGEQILRAWNLEPEVRTKNASLDIFNI